MNISLHPLLKQAYELSQALEELPAHPGQTTLVIRLGRWREGLYKHLEEQGLLQIPPSQCLTPLTEEEVARINSPDQKFNEWGEPISDEEYWVAHPELKGGEV